MAKVAKMLLQTQAGDKAMLGALWLGKGLKHHCPDATRLVH
jgi:hypothetical protein